ncbi:hypothetical protein E2320_003463, partial [Naja naja]
LPPLSLCNDPCPLGKRKNKIEGQKFCCYTCSQCPEKMISRQMDEALKIPHEWYQEGELIIGGLMSQVHYLFPKISFKRHPSMESVDIPLDFGNQAFGCLVPNKDAPDDGGCTGEERLDDLLAPFFETSMLSHSYSIYNAVNAQALHAAHILRAHEMI